MRYRREQACDVFDEMLPLLEKHYLEIAHFRDIAFEPDKEQYLKIDELGLSRVFTARNVEGKLIGYAVYFVRSNMHYKSSLQAVQDVIYIDRAHRGFGAEFIHWCDVQLNLEGVQAVYHHVKVAHNWGPMLERLGYKMVDLIYTKRLDHE